MRRGRRLGEGFVIAIALALTLALALALWWNRRPREESVPPVHAVELEALRNLELIDINAADAEKLEELPGIGPALAAAIVTYREEHGPFESVEALDEVRGIGPAKLEAVRPYIRLK